MKVYTTFILSASITRGVTYAKLTHTVAEGRYTTAPYLFSATGAWAAPDHMTWYLPWRTCTYPKAQRAACTHPPGTGEGSFAIQVRTKLVLVENLSVYRGVILV